MRRAIRLVRPRPRLEPDRSSPVANRVRSFDPVRVGTWECRAWVAYYQRRWLAVMTASVGLVRAGFGMSWIRTLRGAWMVLRANLLWARHPANDPAGARRQMERFYRLVADAAGERLDAATAARLEVEWWRVHRKAQHAPPGTAEDGPERIAAALADLYTFVYGCHHDDVRPAAALRAEAMVVSDQWVREGCPGASPLVERERALLVRSYAALLAVVHR